jgi:hypothetical protein
MSYFVSLDWKAIKGIYGPTKDQFAKRLSYLQHEAAESFLNAQGDTERGLVVSDMFRSMKASYERKYPPGRPPRKDVQPPGFSAHNFGLAIDLAVDETMKGLGIKKKPELDAFMAEYGWYCHRKDGQRGSEDWHFNYLGYLIPKDNERSTAGAIERKIRALYEPFACEPPSDVRAFQARYGLTADGVFGPITRRLYWLELNQPSS